jgi:hypothetical protein
MTDRYADMITPLCQASEVAEILGTPESLTHAQLLRATADAVMSLRQAGLSTTYECFRWTPVALAAVAMAELYLPANPTTGPVAAVLERAARDKEFSWR